MRNLFSLALLLATSVTAVQAGTIISNTLGSTPTSSAGQIGQSFTTPGTASGWDNITFNFYSNATTAAASGTAFILTQAYAGTPNNLSSATTGFVGSSTGIVAGVYQFAPSVTLLANKTYFVYENTSFASGALIGGASGSGLYLANNGTTPFAVSTGSANFNVSGTATPEPATFSLVGLVAMAGFAARLRRRKSASATK